MGSAEIVTNKNKDVSINIKDLNLKTNIATILLLGNTGSGKFTFLELQSKSLNQVSSLDILSATKECLLYKFVNNVAIIDTPGIYDSEGDSQKLLDQVYDKCYHYYHINGVIIFHKFNGRVDEILQIIIENYCLLLANKKKIF